MTPERAAYHRLMLLAGLQEEFARELDFALETEDPITAPILDLAFCMSDLNQTISVLYNYTLDYSVDEQQVHQVQLHKQVFHVMDILNIHYIRSQIFFLHLTHQVVFH